MKPDGGDKSKVEGSIRYVELGQHESAARAATPVTPASPMAYNLKSVPRATGNGGPFVQTSIGIAGSAKIS